MLRIYFIDFIITLLNQGKKYHRVKEIYNYVLENRICQQSWGYGYFAPLLSEQFVYYLELETSSCQVLTVKIMHLAGRGVSLLAFFFFFFFV